MCGKIAEKSYILSPRCRKFRPIWHPCSTIIFRTWNINLEAKYDRAWGRFQSSVVAIFYDTTHYHAMKRLAVFLHGRRISLKQRVLDQLTLLVIIISFVFSGYVAVGWTVINTLCPFFLFLIVTIWSNQPLVWELFLSFLSEEECFNIGTKRIELKKLYRNLC